jgi:hypothetical protein
MVPLLKRSFTEAFLSSKKDDNGANTKRPTAGSSSDAEIQKNLQTDQAERENAFKDFWPKIKQLIPFVYLKRDAWLEFLV